MSAGSKQREAVFHFPFSGFPPGSFSSGAGARVPVNSLTELRMCRTRSKKQKAELFFRFLVFSPEVLGLGGGSACTSEFPHRVEGV